jgi:hypothetical protein
MEADLLATGKLIASKIYDLGVVYGDDGIEQRAPKLAQALLEATDPDFTFKSRKLDDVELFFQKLRSGEFTKPVGNKITIELIRNAWEQFEEGYTSYAKHVQKQIQDKRKQLADGLPLERDVDYEAYKERIQEENAVRDALIADKKQQSAEREAFRVKVENEYKKDIELASEKGHVFPLGYLQYLASRTQTHAGFLKFAQKDDKKR